MSTGTPAGDRWLEAIREIVRQELAASAPYAGVYDYVVTNSDGTTCDAVPADTSRGLPPVTGIPILSGIPGAKVTPAEGSRIGIGFLDCNPTKPFVWGLFDQNEGTVAFNSGTNPVARQGDSVIVFFPPAIPFTGAAVIAGVPSTVTGVMTPAQPAMGTIQVGNPKVTA